MGIIMVGNGSLLHQVLINSNEGAGVSTRNVRDSFNLASHHDDGSLDALDVQVVLASWFVVRAHDSDFLAS
jgi:hypothetical protein